MEDMLNGGRWNLKEMQGKLDEIEKRILELKALGTGIPAVEKNTRDMLNCIYVLKFGISDIADMKK